jgi:hypothetical protein
MSTTSVELTTPDKSSGGLWTTVDATEENLGSAARSLFRGRPGKVAVLDITSRHLGLEIYHQLELCVTLLRIRPVQTLSKLETPYREHQT